MRNKPMHWACALLLLLGRAPSTAHAQQTGWKPEGNVEFVVGAGAGGENDRIARAIQHVLLKEKLVESMTVLNKPGAVQTTISRRGKETPTRSALPQAASSTPLPATARSCTGR